VNDSTPDERRRAKEAEHRALVAQVDAILTADKAPEPTFASRAESGTITWAKAAAEAKQWKRERDEQLKRDKARLDAFLRGLTAAMEVHRRFGNQYIADLLALLDEADRKRFAVFLGRLKLNSGGICDLVADTDDPAQALAAAALERVVQVKKPDHVLYALLAALCGILSHGAD
jgi:hypothetical protein